jgi:hypothetical protein
VLPPEVTARVSVEQASTFGWAKYVGATGRSIGMRSFGARSYNGAIFMNDNARAADRDALLDKFAAELTGAAYYIALRHGAAGTWLDLELALWRALADMVKTWEREIAPGQVPLGPAGLPQR